MAFDINAHKKLIFENDKGKFYKTLATNDYKGLSTFLFEGNDGLKEYVYLDGNEIIEGDSSLEGLGFKMDIYLFIKGSQGFIRRKSRSK
jgi:hypothetical protein